MHLVLLLYALFASVFVICKTALNYASPFFLIGSRMFVAGGLMVAFELLRKRGRLALERGALLRLAALGLINIYLTNALEFWGLQHLTSFKTCFIYSLSPFLSALLCYFLFSEVLNKKKWLGLVIGFLGFIPVMISSSPVEELSGQFLIFSWAELSVAGAAASSVYGWILLGQIIKENKLSPILANGISMLFGGSLALVHSALQEAWDPLPVREWAPFLECAFALILISNLLAYNLYGFLLKRYSAPFISFAGFTTPLFTALFGWYFLGEVAGAPFYLSASVVFAGLFLFHQEELKKSRKAALTSA